ncbi:hypothetical protein GDO78_015956, partial [Eleutherodactylus coqui]
KQLSLPPESSVISSSLLFLEKGKTWHKMWAYVPKSDPLVLYLQVCSQDGRNQRAIPLPGYEVSLPSPSDKVDLKHVFKLTQSQQTLLFGAEDEDLLMKWMGVLGKASRGGTTSDTDYVENI